MPNQLTNRVKPMPPFDEHDLANAAERSQSQLSFAQSETQRQGQQASLPQWFGSQSLQRKYLIGWLASGVLSAVGIAGAGIWFTASVNHIQQADQASTQLSPTEKQSRLEPMLQRASQQQLLAIALVLAANTGVLLLLYRAIAQPVKQLQQDAQMFLLGDQQIRADVKTTDEIGKIARMFNQMADGAVATETLLAEQARQREIEMQQMRLMSQMSSSRVHTLQDLDGIFEQAVEGAKTILAVDRVVVYRFHPDWSGEISAEAVTPGLPSALANTIKDACISANLIEAYRQGRVIATSDVFNAGFDPEHLKLMTTLHIKANLVTPILQGDKLYGLLIAHHCTATHSWNSGEIDFLKEIAIQIGLSLERSTFLEQKEADTDRGQQLYQISSRARRALTSQEIYNITLQGVRETLKTDRAIVYLFDEDWKGTIVAEAVGRKYPTALGAAIADPCFAERYVEKYKQGRVQTLEDIDNAGLTECHLAQLAPFQVKASMVAPILAGNRLHGLLITHQCSQTRCWQAVEIEFFKEIAAQLGLSLDQMDVLQQLEQSRQQAEQLLEEQRHQKEALQWQLVTLLDQVEGAASGNLTVRADVTDGELGTVADFFNAIIESLRQIVVEVKRSTTQVNTSLGENEATIQQLAVEALKQSKDITQTLNSVDQMTASIQAVAESAQQAAAVTRTASTTAEASQVAIDFTVHSIFELRETMSETAHKMKRLGESSQAISKVISLINQIALKTNMLALNAGIEAARAGENGLGFAVVAEEVGELAAQSASATQEIEQLVDDIQRETRQVIEAMEQSTVQMVEGTRLVEDAKQNLGHLRQLSQQTDQLVQSISDATVSQTQISQAVTGLMRELAQVSQRTAQSSQQVTDSLQQTVGIAQALQLSVSAFKVEVPDHKLMVI